MQFPSAGRLQHGEVCCNMFWFSNAGSKASKSCIWTPIKWVPWLQGNPDAPRCGFSQKVVTALRSIGVSFDTFDILTDEEVRQGLKEYSQWPTYPQLYVKGELLGGCDVILELQQDGMSLLGRKTKWLRTSSKQSCKACCHIMQRFCIAQKLSNVMVCFWPCCYAQWCAIQLQ